MKRLIAIFCSVAISTPAFAKAPGYVQLSLGNMEVTSEYESRNEYEGLAGIFAAGFGDIFTVNAGYTGVWKQSGMISTSNANRNTIDAGFGGVGLRLGPFHFEAGYAVGDARHKFQTDAQTFPDYTYDKALDVSGFRGAFTITPIRSSDGFAMSITGQYLNLKSKEFEHVVYSGGTATTTKTKCECGVEATGVFLTFIKFM